MKKGIIIIGVIALLVFGGLGGYFISQTRGPEQYLSPEDKELIERTGVDVKKAERLQREVEERMKRSSPVPATPASPRATLTPTPEAPVKTLPSRVTIENIGPSTLNGTHEVSIYSYPKIVNINIGAPLSPPIERWRSDVIIKDVVKWSVNKIVVKFHVEFNEGEGKLRTFDQTKRGRLVEIKETVGEGKIFTIEYPIEATHAKFWIEVVK